MIEEGCGRCFDDAVRDGMLAYAEGPEVSVCRDRPLLPLLVYRGLLFRYFNRMFL